MSRHRADQRLFFERRTQRGYLRFMLPFPFVHRLHKIVDVVAICGYVIRA
jgi:hypothetical protein